MTRLYTLFRCLRNLMAIIGVVTVWIAIGMAHAGYFAGIDLGGAAIRAAWSVAFGVAWVIAVVVVAIVGPFILQVLYSRWERNREN